MDADLSDMPRRFAAALEASVRDLHITLDRPLPRRRPVPAWCRSPLLRGFVMGNALAAPLLLLLFVWSR